MLSDEYPDTASLWHYERNYPLTPQEVTSSSSKEVWWHCPESGGYYRRTVKGQVRAKISSPIVAGTLVWKGYNDLLSQYPHIAELWDEDTNNISADQVFVGDRKKYSWVCPESGHMYTRNVSQQVSAGTRSPYMVNKKVAPGYNDLSSKRPEIAALWHPVKNGDLTPEMVTEFSHKKVWWTIQGVDKFLGIRVMCEKLHPEKTAIPLTSSYPEIADLWSGRNDVSPDDVSAGSNFLAWWTCPDSGTDYQRTVASQVKCRGISPYVARDGVSIISVLSGFNDFQHLHPELAELWSQQNKSRPDEFLPGSRKVVWWTCPESGVDYQRSIRNQVKSGRMSPFMSGKQIAVGYNDLSTTDPHVAEWLADPSDGIAVTAGSDTIVTWKCDKGHTFESSPSSMVRTISDGKTGCPVCWNVIVVPGSNDIATLYPHLIPEWDDDDDPTMTAPHSRPISWKCSNGHQWKAKLHGRVTRGYGCRRCSASGGEKKLVSFIESLGFEPISNDRTKIAPLELDIYIPGENIAVEYNGSYWHSDKFLDKNYHHNKWKKCKDQGIQLITVWEDEWMTKQDIVESMISHKLGVSDMPVVYARKTDVVVIDHSDASTFLDNHHIQGGARGSAYLGLLTGDELVAVSVWKKNLDALYLERYATSMTVVGGMGKLLKAGVQYAQERGCSRIVTFADHCVSDGGLYEKLGFRLDGELKPDYRYLVGASRVHKFNYRLKRFRDDPELEYVEGMSERELALLNNIPRVYDCGKSRYIFDVP